MRVAEFQRTIGYLAFVKGPKSFLKLDRAKTIQVLPNEGFEELLKPN